MRKRIQLSNKVVCNEDTSVLGFFDHLNCHRQLQGITFLTGMLQLGTCTSNCEAGILAMSYTRLQGMWNPPSCCCFWHTFSRTKQRGYIYLDIHGRSNNSHDCDWSNNSCSYALQPCQKGGMQRGERPHWQKHTEGVGRGRLGWKKANESFLITKCPAWVYQQHHGGGGERDIPWVTINRK